MAEVKLTRGYIATVDDADRAAVSKFHWQVFINRNEKTIYAQRAIVTSDGRKSSQLLHHFIWELHKFPPVLHQIDHRDRNGLPTQKLQPVSMTHGQRWFLANLLG